MGGAISSGEPVMRAGAYDQTRGCRPVPMCWSSRRRRSTEDLEIVGPVTVRLWIASDAPDTDFTAKLIDVYPPSADYPDGFAMNLTEGMLRVRYRDSWERPAPMTPGEVYAITIELFPIANLFRRGHRLRLDISSSNFPHFDVNPNSGEPEGSWLHPRLARNRVFAAAERPSHILLAGHSHESGRRPAAIGPRQDVLNFSALALRAASSRPTAKPDGEQAGITPVFGRKWDRTLIADRNPV